MSKHPNIVKIDKHREVIGCLLSITSNLIKFIKCCSNSTLWKWLESFPYQSSQSKPHAVNCKGLHRMLIYKINRSKEIQPVT